MALVTSLAKLLTERYATNMAFDDYRFFAKILTTSGDTDPIGAFARLFTATTI